MAEKYARLESSISRSANESARREFRAELQKVVDEFVAEPKNSVTSIEDAATARKYAQGDRTAHGRVEGRRQHRGARAAPGPAGHDRRRRSQPKSAPAVSRTRVALRRSISGSATACACSRSIRKEWSTRSARTRSASRSARSASASGERIYDSSNGAARIRRERPSAASGLPKGVSVSLQDQPADRQRVERHRKTVNEATEAADKFLDAAYLDNY